MQTKEVKMFLNELLQCQELNVIYPHSGILFSDEKEETTGTHRNRNEFENITLSERGQAQKTTYYMVPLI